MTSRVCGYGPCAAPAGLTIEAEALNAEPNFAQNHQLINVQAGNVIFGVQAPLDLPVNTGWKVSVVIDESKAYLFDGEKEVRITPPAPETAEAVTTS